MIVYTATELRKNMKDALDAANTQPVRIRRGDDFFELTKVGTIYGINIVSEKKIDKSVYDTSQRITMQQAIKRQEVMKKSLSDYTDDPTYTDLEPTA